MLKGVAVDGAATQHASKRMPARGAIEYTCRLLRSYGVESLNAELLRQAKFGREEVCALLGGVCVCQGGGGGAEAENALPADIRAHRPQHTHTNIHTHTHTHMLRSRRAHCSLRWWTWPWLWQLVCRVALHVACGQLAAHLCMVPPHACSVKVSEQPTAIHSISPPPAC